MFNVRDCKRTQNIIAKWRSFKKEQTMGFLLLVMLVIGVFVEVRQLSYTNSDFIMMITIVFLEAP